MTNAEARFNKIHIRKVYACLAVTCHLHFWQNDRDFLHATVVTRVGTDTEIRVSTESRPWRRKFSHRSSRDSNPRPFNHESGALTTELSRMGIPFYHLRFYQSGFNQLCAPAGHFFHPCLTGGGAGTSREAG